jgi:hypothetical protein
LYQFQWKCKCWCRWLQFPHAPFVWTKYQVIFWG